MNSIKYLFTFFFQPVKASISSAVKNCDANNRNFTTSSNRATEVHSTMKPGKSSPLNINSHMDCIIVKHKQKIQVDERSASDACHQTNTRKNLVMINYNIDKTLNDLHFVTNLSNIYITYVAENNINRYHTDSCVTRNLLPTLNSAADGDDVSEPG